MRGALITVNEDGRRVGESHPRAKLTDHEVELIRQLLDEGGLTQKGIADKFDVSYSTVKSISCCRRRAQTPARVKRIAKTGEPEPAAIDRRTAAQRRRDFELEGREECQRLQSTGRPATREELMNYICRSLGIAERVLTREELERIVRGEPLRN